MSNDEFFLLKSDARMIATICFMTMINQYSVLIILFLSILFLISGYLLILFLGLYLFFSVIPYWSDNETRNKVQPFMNSLAKKWFGNIMTIGFVAQQNKKNMICMHPYSISLTSFMFMFCDQTFNDYKVITNDLIVKLPLMQMLCKMFGIYSDKTNNVHKLMSSKSNVMLFPGGPSEISVYKHNSHNVSLSDRKDFIKYALKYGYSIQPCYFFSDTAMFYKYNGLEEDEKVLAKQSIRMTDLIVQICTIPWGYFFAIPKKVPIMIGIGEKIILPQITDPSDDDINTWHETYKDALVSLFNNNIEQWKKIHPKSDSQINVF